MTACYIAQEINKLSGKVLNLTHEGTGEHVATFTCTEAGLAVFGMVKEAIAREGSTLFLSTSDGRGGYVAGPLSVLLKE